MLRILKFQCYSVYFIVLVFFILSNFVIISVAKEKINVKLAPAIPMEAPATLSEETIQTPPLVAEKQLKPYLCHQKQQKIYLIFCCSAFFLEFLS